MLHKSSLGPARPNDISARLSLEFSNWIAYFNGQSPCTNQMQQNFGNLVKAANDLTQGKMAANTNIIPKYKEKAASFLQQAALFLNVEINELPTKQQLVNRAFAVANAAAQQRNVQSMDVRTRYYSRLFKQSMPAKSSVGSKSSNAIASMKDNVETQARLTTPALTRPATAPAELRSLSQEKSSKVTMRNV